MNLVYFEEFKEELDDAVAWYNSQLQGLGNAFAASVAATIEHIQRMPLAAPPLGQRYRRKQVKRFPYAVIYEVRDFELRATARILDCENAVASSTHFCGAVATAPPQ